MLEPDVFTRGDILLPADPFDPTKKPSVNQVVQGYVDLLKSDKAGFIKTEDNLGSHQYAVNLAKLRHTMKCELLDGLVNDKFGLACCRIVRILCDKGKLDESQVQKYAMLPLKDVRFKLSTLLTAGIVEIQVKKIKKKKDHFTNVLCRKCLVHQIEHQVVHSTYGTSR